MEFYPAIFVRSQSKTIIATVPVPTRLRSDGPIVAVRIELEFSAINDNIANAVIGIACGRIPIGNHAFGCRKLPVSDRVKLFAAKRPIVSAGSVDLAAIEL
jgi:hypothetical protein